MADIVTGLQTAKAWPEDAAPPTEPTADPATDQLSRCAWAATTLDYAHYHDTEWGSPTTAESAVFERLCLEGFQAGLSWLTILRKRENFRAAFAQFDPPTVAHFDEDDIARLLEDPGIVRHRGKIEATIANARATTSLWQSGQSLSNLVWSHQPPEHPAPKDFSDVPAQTPQSKQLARTLKAHGFRFVGPTTAYAAMQAIGVVNDHLAGCWVRQHRP